MPASDFRLYQAYYQKQPFGLWRQDYNSARIAQSMSGGKLQDLMPFWFDDEPIDDDFEQLFIGAVQV